MKGIAKRSKLMFALVAIFLAGVIVLAATFGINAETWVFKRANKHIYSSGQIVAAGTIYDRPGMGPGYGAEPLLQRAADIDYAQPQPSRRYTVRTPGVNRTTGNGIFTGR